MMNEDKDNDSKNITYITLAYTLIAGMIFFIAIGYFIDKKIGESQIWTLVGIFFGLFYGAYEIWKIIRKEN